MAADVDNKSKYILILDEESIQQLDDTALTAEAIYLILHNQIKDLC